MPWPSGGLKTWVPGETVTADLMNAQLRDPLNILKTYVDDNGKPTWIAYARQSADITKNSNTTFADLTGLGFVIGAAETWQFRAVLFAEAANATPDMKFTITGPASPGEVLFGVTAADGVPLTAGYINAFGGTVAIEKTTVPSVILLDGIIVNGPNAGIVQLQFAQNTGGSATNSVIKAGSRLLATRLL